MIVTDNLYLDINGIIYKCVKDEGNLFKDFVKSKQFNEIWELIMNALNEIMKLVNPRKVVFLALDGVPPRAKTNQSRSRRFLAAKSHSELD